MSMDQTFFGADFGQLNSQDPEIAGVLLSELDRLRGGLQLIASENFTSPAVLAALFGAGVRTLDSVFDGLAAHAERHFDAGVLDALVD